MSIMKILFLARRFYPLIGGVEKHCFELGRRLTVDGHEVTILTENEKLEFKQQESLEGLRIVRIPIRRREKWKKFEIWFWLIKNINLFKENDVVHCHDVFYWYLPLRFIFPFKKVFTTFHGYEGNKPPTFNKIFQHKLAELLSNGNICIGDFHKRWYKTNPNIVSYGAADNFFKVTSENRYDFCYIGRLSEDTGIMSYLGAVKILKDRGCETKTVVCGDGPQMIEAKEFCLINNLNVKFLGFVDSPEKYLSQAKFAFISRYLAIIEALQQKKLIFAVFDSEIKEDYLKMAPFSKYIIIESVAVELANKIEYYLNNKQEEKEKVDKGFLWAKEQTWEKLANQYLKLWQK